MPQLDSDLLRTFLAIAETGSVTGGARRIHRSQSATSLQIKQLEEIVGRPLFRRHGRGVALTAAGEGLIPVARRVVRALDRALSDLRGEGLSGPLRVGAPDDHVRTALTAVIADFSARHPNVALQVRCEAGIGFGAALEAGRLDLAVFEVPAPQEGDVILREDRLVWMRRAESDFASCEALPVALFDRDCWWRTAALAELEAMERPFRVVFASESAAGVRSAVQAGVAVGLLNAAEAQDGLAPVEEMGTEVVSFLVMRRSPTAEGAAAQAMAEAVRLAFR